MAGYLAAAGGFVGWYLSWCLWACLLAKRACAPAGSLEIADSPEQLWAAVKTAGSAGAWSFLGHEAKGAVLWAVWVVETLAYFYFTIGRAITAAAAPYSESHEKWGPLRISDAFLSLPEGPEEPEATLKKLAQGDLSWLRDAKWTDPDEDTPGPGVEVDIYADDEAPEVYISVKYLPPKARKRVKKSRMILDRALAPERDSRHIRAALRITERQKKKKKKPPVPPPREGAGGKPAAAATCPPVAMAHGF
jgi:hypothetical protein